VVFKVGLRFVPLYVGLMGYDQLSGEVGPRSIRYLTVRSRRSSVTLGKVLAQFLLLAGLSAVVNLLLLGYGLATEKDFGAGAVLLTGLRFWGVALVFSLPYLALTSLCSSLVRTPMVSLVLNVILLFGIWLIAAVGDASETLHWLRYLSPWNYSEHLLHPDPRKLSVAVGAHLGFALLFLGSGWALLRRRDL
jgi:ABC-2 type transport system permease protein